MSPFEQMGAYWKWICPHEVCLSGNGSASAAEVAFKVRRAHIRELENHLRDLRREVRNGPTFVSEGGAT